MGQNVLPDAEEALPAALSPSYAEEKGGGERGGTYRSQTGGLGLEQATTC